MKLKKHILLIPILVTTIQFGYCQVVDSLNYDLQFFKVKNNETIGFKKPTFGQIFKYIPSDLCDLGKFIVQKQNLKWNF